MNLLLDLPIAWTKARCLVGSVTLFAASSLAAQTSYTVVDLSTTTSGQGTALATSSGQAAGATFTPVSTYQNKFRAALWTGNGLSDLHPAALLGGEGSNVSSLVLGFSGNLQVGSGVTSAATTHTVALAWNDTAASARVLVTPFAALYAQALATDGTQIVGYVTPEAEGGAASPHALLWNAATGSVTDLGGGTAVAVARGQQVGYTGTNKGDQATLWNGTNKATSLHPKNYETSRLVATDGSRQAGYVTVSTKVKGEGPKGGGGTTYSSYSAALWSGTAASMVTMNNPWQQAVATGLSSTRMVGYAFDGYLFGNVASYHAIVWNTATRQPTDLNAFLPTGYTGAMANAVDAQGNIAGSIFTVNGEQHAAVWLPNP